MAVHFRSKEPGSPASSPRVMSSDYAFHFTTNAKWTVEICSAITHLRIKVRRHSLVRFHASNYDQTKKKPKSRPPNWPRTIELHGAEPSHHHLCERIYIEHPVSHTETSINHRGNPFGILVRTEATTMSSIKKDFFTDPFCTRAARVAAGSASSKKRMLVYIPDGHCSHVQCNGVDN